jgi:hypothetical protein
LLPLLLAAPAPLLSAQDMNAEELVARHLASIGTPQARAAIKTRMVRGDMTMDVVLGGKGTMQGKAVLLSAGPRLKFLMRYHSSDYPGEEFTFDGEKPYTAMYRTGTRSKFGSFMEGQDAILREGLLGGTLSTAWALSDVPGRNPKLTYDGLKKVEGRKLHQLTYRPRNGGDQLTIRLYFEPETFRHVYSVYSITVGAQIGPQESQSARQEVTRITLEETFADFSKVGGLDLPGTWKLKFTTEGDSTVILDCRFKATQIENNADLGEDAFRPVGLIPSN